MSEETKNQKGEANFNDSELQDIMAEIESLEQDYSGDESEVEEEVLAEADTQEELSSEPVNEDTQEVIAADDNLEKQSNVSEITPVASSSSESPMEFHGAGVLDFNMSFPVGDQKANVKVEDGQVKVVLGDVFFSISEEGCFVEMAGGVQFSVPAPGHKSIKKAA